MTGSFPPGPELVARFSGVLSRIQMTLFHFARGLVGDVELARDVTQDVFLDAWRAAAAGAPPFDAACHRETAHNFQPLCRAERSAAPCLWLRATI